MFSCNCGLHALGSQECRHLPHSACTASSLVRADRPALLAVCGFCKSISWIGIPAIPSARGQHFTCGIPNLVSPLLCLSLKLISFDIIALVQCECLFHYLSVLHWYVDINQQTAVMSWSLGYCLATTYQELKILIIVLCLTGCTGEVVYFLWHHRLWLAR